MTTSRTLAALSLVSLVTACASPGAPSPASAMPGMVHADASKPMAAMDPRMKAMHDMHQKMKTAKTPAERQALMADHMKSMQGGMAMMTEMHGKQGLHGTQGMAGMTSMGDGKLMQDEMAQREQMKTHHMAMMQMMMEMMSQRMPAASGTP